MIPTPTPHIELRVLDPRLHDWGLPAHQTDMAAAVDLVACLDGPLTIEAGSPAVLIPSGLAILIGDPHITALIVPRSGMGHKRGLVLGNTVGVIDADYAGPVLISAWNRNAPGTPPIVVAPGERIAQMLFVPILRPHFTIIDSFSRTTARGAGGFGSTG
jgi:dUTP pyrophosphatase